MKTKTSLSLNRVIFFLFTCLFFGETYFLSTHSNQILSMPIPLMIVTALATYFVGHVISFYGIGEWVRMFFTHQEQDSSGAGEGSEANEGIFNVLGQLVCCPICSGIWGITFLLTLYSFFPAWGTVILTIMGFGGVAALLHWAGEKWEWEGRNAREQAGTAWLLKNKGGYVNAFNKEPVIFQSFISKMDTVPHD